MAAKQPVMLKEALLVEANVILEVRTKLYHITPYIGKRKR